jgi:hypothetical protein
VESSRALVKHELDLAMEAVKRLGIPAVEPGVAARSTQAAAKHNWFRRWFLLYMPSTFFAWLPRLFFYFCLWMLALEVSDLFTVVMFYPRLVLKDALLRHMTSLAIFVVTFLACGSGAVLWIDGFQHWKQAPESERLNGSAGATGRWRMTCVNTV